MQVVGDDATQRPVLLTKEDRVSAICAIPDEANAVFSVDGGDTDARRRRTSTLASVASAIIVKTRKSWKAALTLSLVGAVVLGLVVGLATAKLFLTANDGAVGLATAATGFLFFGAFGFFCLPEDTAVTNTSLRGTLEGLVVFGWFCGGCYVAMVCAIENHDGPGHAVSPIIFYSLTALYFFGFMPSPIWFVILCWKNLDVNILRLLWTQMQYRFIVVLAVWVMVLFAWSNVFVYEADLFLAICQSAVTVTCNDPFC